LTLSQ